MGYWGGYDYHGCGHGYGYAPVAEYCHRKDSFAIIVVLFILLIIIGASFYC